MMTSLRDALGQIADRYDLRDVYAFGSRAAEITARVRNTDPVEGPRESDVDIAVQPRDGATLGAATLGKALAKSPVV